MNVCIFLLLHQEEEKWKKYILIGVEITLLAYSYNIKADLFFWSLRRVFMKSLWDRPGPRGKACHQNSSEHLFSRPSAERCTNRVLFLGFSLVELPEVQADGGRTREMGKGQRVGNKRTPGMTAAEELNINSGGFEKATANIWRSGHFTGQRTVPLLSSQSPPPMTCYKLRARPACSSHIGAFGKYARLPWDPQQRHNQNSGKACYLIYFFIENKEPLSQLWPLGHLASILRGFEAAGLLSGGVTANTDSHAKNKAEQNYAKLEYFRKEDRFHKRLGIKHNHLAQRMTRVINAMQHSFSKNRHKFKAKKEQKRKRNQREKESNCGDGI